MLYKPASLYRKTVSCPISLAIAKMMVFGHDRGQDLYRNQL
jgi:hypothetical protein